jgi:hypothetical protein
MQSSKTIEVGGFRATRVRREETESLSAKRIKSEAPELWETLDGKGLVTRSRPTDYLRVTKAKEAAE